MECIFSLAEVPTVAEEVLKALKGRTVIAFHGEMGSGKTTFIAQLCRHLGVEDLVNSPTFSIINAYQTRTGETIYHMDLYRIGSVQEAVEVGVEDCVASGNLCLVEWPERAAELFENALHCNLTIVNNGLRKMVINA